MAEFVVLAELIPGTASQATPATAIAPTARCFSLMRKMPPFFFQLHAELLRASANQHKCLCALQENLGLVIG